MTDGLRGQTAAQQVLPTQRALLAHQLGVVKPRGFAVDFEDAPFGSGKALIRVAFRHGNPGPLRQMANGLHIIQIFNPADKRDHIAARTAPKAVKRTVFGVHMKRRRLFTVKRTEPGKGSAAVPQIDVG